MESTVFYIFCFQIPQCHCQPPFLNLSDSIRLLYHLLVSSYFPYRLLVPHFLYIHQSISTLLYCFGIGVFLFSHSFISIASVIQYVYMLTCLLTMTSTCRLPYFFMLIVCLSLVLPLSVFYLWFAYLSNTY